MSPQLTPLVLPGHLYRLSSSPFAAPDAGLESIAYAPSRHEFSNCRCMARYTTCRHHNLPHPSRYGE
jgi:hypothetical protein